MGEIICTIHRRAGRQAGQALLEQPLGDDEEVGLGDDADELPGADHGQGAEAVLLHDLDRLEGLQRTDDAGKHPEHARLGARRGKLGRRRFRKEAAGAGTRLLGVTRPEEVTPWIATLEGEQTLANCGTIRAVTLSGPPPATPEPIGPGGPKERSGCLVALYVVLGLGLLLIVIAGIGSWLFLRSEQGQRVLEAARQCVVWAEAFPDS